MINQYSYRIQELEICDRISLSFLQSMSFRDFSLPKLRLLKWDVSFDKKSIIYIRPLLSPSLVVLDARIIEDKDEILFSFLRNYPLLCPDLRSVTLDLTQSRGVKEDTGTFASAISAAIVSHKLLECLSLFSPTDNAALDHILMSPTLKMLSMTGDAGVTESHLSKASILPTTIPFRNVVNLDLEILNLLPITDLLRPDEQRFGSIRLHVHSPQECETVREFLVALATRQRKDTLQSLVLDTSGNPSLSEGSIEEFAGRHMYYLSYEVLRPLTYFGRLRVLVVRLYNGISLDDNELAIMAGSWPFLEVLELTSLDFRRDVWPMAKCVTLFGILALLASCPKLRNFDLPLDAREVPESPLPIPCNTVITSLHLADRPINDPDRVAQFLDVHLPSVSSVFDRYYSLTDRGRMWRKVDDYVSQKAKRYRDKGIHT